MKARQSVRAPAAQAVQGGQHRSQPGVRTNPGPSSRFQQGKQRAPSPPPIANRIAVQQQQQQQTPPDTTRVKRANRALACLVLDSVHAAVSAGVQSFSPQDQKGTQKQQNDDYWWNDGIYTEPGPTTTARRASLGRLQALARDGCDEGRFASPPRACGSSVNLGNLGHLMMTPSFEFESREEWNGYYAVIPREKQEILQLIDELHPIFERQSTLREYNGDTRRLMCFQVSHLSNALRMCDANIAYLQGRRDVGAILFPPVEASMRPNLHAEHAHRQHSVQSSQGRYGAVVPPSARSTMEARCDCVREHHRCGSGACLLDYDRMTARQMTIEAQRRIADMACVRCIYEEEMARQELLLCEDQWRACIGVLWHASDALDPAQPSLHHAPSTQGTILPIELDAAVEDYAPVSNSTRTATSYEHRRLTTQRTTVEGGEDCQRGAAEHRNSGTQTGKCEDHRAEMAEWQLRTSHATNQIAELEAQLVALEERVRNATSSADALRIENTTLKSALHDGESRIAALAAELSERDSLHERALDALREQLKLEAVDLVETHQQEVKEYAHLLREETARCETFESTIRELEVWVKDLRERNVALEVLNVERQERSGGASFVDHHQLQERLLTLQTFFISAMYSTRCDLEWMEHNEWVSLMDTASILRELSQSTRGVYLSTAAASSTASAVPEQRMGANTMRNDAVKYDEYSHGSSTHVMRQSSRGSILAPRTGTDEIPKGQRSQETVSRYYDGAPTTHSSTAPHETHVRAASSRSDDVVNDGATARVFERNSPTPLSPSALNHRHHALQWDGGRKSRSCSPGKVKERALVLTEMALPFKSSSSNASNDTDTCYCFYVENVTEETSGQRHVDVDEATGTADATSTYRSGKREPSPVPLAPGALPDAGSSLCSISPITQRRSGTNENMSDLENEEVPGRVKEVPSRSAPTRAVPAPAQLLGVDDGARTGPAPATRTTETHLTYVRTSNTTTYFTTSPEPLDSRDTHHALPPLPPRPIIHSSHEKMHVTRTEHGDSKSEVLSMASSSTDALPAERRNDGTELSKHVVGTRPRLEDFENEEEDSDDGDSDDDLVMLEVTRPGGLDGLLQRERGMLNDKEGCSSSNSPEEMYLKDPLIISDAVKPASAHGSRLAENSGHASNTSLNRSPPRADGASTLLEEERQLLREVKQSLSAMSSPNNRSRQSESGSPRGA